MAKKIRNIYKGNHPVNYTEIEGIEPLKVVVTDENCSEAIVYSKVNHCTITITYGETTLEYEAFQGDTLKNIAATLNESAINTAIPGQSLLYWYILNNGVEEKVTPSSSSEIADCLNDIVINGDIVIQGIYNLNTYTLYIYDYDHTTLVQSINVDYGTTYDDALIDFDYSNKLSSPSTKINTRLYSWVNNGWTLTKNSNILDTELGTKTITKNTSIYACYAIGEKIPYTMNFMIYSEPRVDWVWDGAITCYLDESYNKAMQRINDPEEDYLSYLSSVDYGTFLRVYNTDNLFYDPQGTSAINKDTVLSTIPESRFQNNTELYLYIGYTDVVKTYSVKLYDELAGIYLYQNTEIIHGTKISRIEDLGTQISNIQLGNYKSELEDLHHTYTYWLEYSDGTDYNINDTVTSNLELIIRYTETPKVYTITFQTVVHYVTADDEDTVTTTIDTTTATYDSNFSLPNSCFKLIGSTSSKYSDDGKYIINSSYASEWISTSNSSRQFTGNHTLKCIGDETFIIAGSATYSTPSIEYEIYDQGILYPKKEETLIVDGTVSTITELYSALITLANTKGEDYSENGLYFYNTPGTIKVYCEKIDGSDADEYTADGLEVAEGYYSDLPQSLTGVSKIYVYVTARSQCISTVTVTWYNNQTSKTIKTEEIQKGWTYEDLTYPSAPSVSGYTFTGWSPGPYTTTPILENVTIRAFYTVTATEPETPATPTTPGVYVKDSSGNYTKVISLSNFGGYISMVPVSATITINSTTKSSATGWLKGTFSILMIPLDAYSSTTSFPRMYVTTDEDYVSYRSTSGASDMPPGYYYNTTVYGGDIEVKYDDSSSNTQRSMSCTIWALDNNPSSGESWTGSLDIKAAIAEGAWSGTTSSNSTHDYVTLKLVYKSSQNSESD